MHNIFLAVSSMIVAGFLMKSYRKLREKPDWRDLEYDPKIYNKELL